SFYMGTSNDNYDEIMRTDSESVCGIKIFMGSSTGNLLVDDKSALRKIFANCPMLIATHCEDEDTIKKNHERLIKIYGSDHLEVKHHPTIRSSEGCLMSSTFAVQLAKEFETRLHVLHISTEEELALFQKKEKLKEKRITSEVCVHHLYFDASDYEKLGNMIKCNPAIKAPHNKGPLFAAMLEDRLDVIATDHAPHTLEEKMENYLSAPSGLPLIQHSLNIMLDFYIKGSVTLEKIVEKMCHAPAECFRIKERGYLREGYMADIVIVDLDYEWQIDKSNILYKCKWSPLQGMRCKGRVEEVLLNGGLAFSNGNFLLESGHGKRLVFTKN
ncbi:MAG: amidohydrolase family protein, partial [Saprospiraceae bacterium]|nr:amidohydrolase family protein [Saprospiraceae bacterium]